MLVSRITHSMKLSVYMFFLLIVLLKSIAFRYNDFRNNAEAQYYDRNQSAPKETYFAKWDIEQNIDKNINPDKNFVFDASLLASCSSFRIDTNRKYINITNTIGCSMSLFNMY